MLLIFNWSGVCTALCSQCRNTQDTVVNVGKMNSSNAGALLTMRLTTTKSPQYPNSYPVSFNFIYLLFYFIFSFLLLPLLIKWKRHWSTPPHNQINSNGRIEVSHSIPSDIHTWWRWWRDCTIPWPSLYLLNICNIFKMLRIFTRRNNTWFDQRRNSHSICMPKHTRFPVLLEMVRYIEEMLIKHRQNMSNIDLGGGGCWWDREIPLPIPPTTYFWKIGNQKKISIHFTFLSFELH